MYRFHSHNMMQPPRSSLLLALLICSALSSHVSPKKPGRSFNIPQVFRSGSTVDGPTALKRAYAKYGIVPTDIDFGQFGSDPPGVSRAALSNRPQPEEKGAVVNTPTQGDVQYLAPVTIGNQTFIMNLDTGSADTWVFNTQLPNETHLGHEIFDPTQSEAFAPMDGFSFNISYGDGSFAAGGVGSDSVDIGGATVEKQAIGLPNTVSESFVQNEDSDGIVGLAFSAINTIRPETQRTFFDNIAEDLQEPVFTAQLRQAAPGSYEFGTVNASKFQGDLIDVPVITSNGHWEFLSSFYSVGDNGNVQTANRGRGTAIADTGTTLMLVHDEVAEAYYSQTDNASFSPQAGGFIFPCSTELPDFLVSVGDTHLVRIDRNLLNFQSVIKGDDGDEMCFGGIQGNNGFELQVFGDIFFKAVFAVFDMRGPTMRFADHAP